MVVKSKYIKKILSQFLLVIYLFVLLFSQNFHNHGSGLEFKNFHFRNSKNTLSKQNFKENSVGCMVCHIISDSHALLPEEFKYNIFLSSKFSLPNTELQSLYLYKKRELSSLRGPPAAFLI